MMISGIALSGIQAAQTKFVKSADRVVNAFSVPDETEQPAVAPVTGVTEIGVGSTAFAASEDVYVEESVSMIEASNAYKANISVLKTWDEMTQEMIAGLTK